MARKTYREDDIVIVLAEGEESQTVGTVLDARKYPRKTMKSLFDEKLVLLNGRKTNPKDLMGAGDELRLQMPKEKLDHEPEPMDLSVLYEDHDLLIVDKPAGLTVNSPGQVSLATGLAHYFKEQGIKRKIRFLNRLDRDTSGCIAIAKSGLAQGLYQQQMDANVFKKYYRANVEGNVWATDLNDSMDYVEVTDICNILTKQCSTTYSLTFPMGRADDGIHQEVRPDGKETRTDFEVLDFDGDRDETKVQVELFTGRTHQIRVAFSQIGHPLVGDVLYGAKETGQPFCLRAHKVSFRHMRTGEAVTVEAD